MGRHHEPDAGGAVGLADGDFDGVTAGVVGGLLDGRVDALVDGLVLAAGVRGRVVGRFVGLADADGFAVGRFQRRFAASAAASLASLAFFAFLVSLAFFARSAAAEVGAEVVADADEVPDVWDATALLTGEVATINVMAAAATTGILSHACNAMSAASTHGPLW